MKYLPLLLLLCCCCAALPSRGNNVKVGGAPALTLEGDNATIDVRFTLSWENSWRDEFNWDAAWVFVKYKKEGSTDAWNHLNLTGTPVMASGYTFDFGKTGAKNVGVFVFRDGKGGGPVSGLDVTLKTTLSELSGITADDIRNGKVYVAVSAVEMVYVPYGAYYLGDGASNNTFADAGKAPVIMDNEAARTIYPKAANGTLGGTISLNANYPKGYKGFYCMKYELSQEQYVSFLNMLSYNQQKARIGNSLDALQKGEYVFGDKSKPSARNGIALFAKQSGKPALFANNLNPAEPYYSKDDGQNVACNFLTPEDMLAYCDWAGVRPMSELEYEKACRRPYPQASLAREYAWNGTIYSRLNSASDLTALNTENEGAIAADKNVNVNVPALGPVRCGSFGTAGSTQAQAGGTFWGAMEMSGNVGEICYGVSATGFNTSDVTASHGNGAINASGVTDMGWPASATAANFALRGGSFASADSNLRVSDRTILSVTNTRDSSVGFRAVRTFGGGSVTLNAGSIAGSNGLVTDTACPGANFTVRSMADAQVSGMSDIPVSYIWYLDGVVIPGQSGAELVYPFENATNALKSIVVTRKAVCAVGETTANTVTVKVPNTTFNLNTKQTIIDACDYTDAITPTAVMSGTFQYTWKYEAGEKVANTYRADRLDFNDKVGENSVICIASIMGCESSTVLKVTIERAADFVQTFKECGDILTDCQGNTYKTLLIGSQCWMGESLVYKPTGGNVACPLDPCTTCGACYTWATAMSGESASSKNPSGVRGVCPKGWHIPSVAEWTSSVQTNKDFVNSSCTYTGKADGSYTNYYGDYWTTLDGSASFYCSGGKFQKNGHVASHRVNVRCVKD